VFKVNESVFRPEDRTQLFACDHFPVGLQEHAQHKERLLLNGHTHALFSQFTSAQIDLESIKARTNQT
jgi:hypothetical protein